MPELFAAGAVGTAVLPSQLFLCRHLEPLGYLSPRLVLRACLFPSWCYERFRRAGCCCCPATARVHLRWVHEHGVPRAAVPSPAVGVSLAAYPAAVVPSTPQAGRSRVMSLLPGAWRVHPQINAASVLLPSVLLCPLLQTLSWGCGCLDPSPGAGGLGHETLSLIFGECQHPPVQVCDYLEGSSADRIPSQPGFASLFPGFVPELPSALAPAAALTCHCCVCAGAWGGRGSPQGAWQRLGASFAWLMLDPASRTGAIGVRDTALQPGPAKEEPHCPQGTWNRRGLPSQGSRSSALAPTSCILHVRQLWCVH